MGNWEKNISLIQNMTNKLNHVEPKTLRLLLHLLLLFNAFEEKINSFNDKDTYKINLKTNKQERKSPREIFQIKYNLNVEFFEETFNFFKERYITNGKINNKFDNLFTTNRKKYIENLLTSNTINDDKKLTVCLEISYRFRNNIFHGNKIVEQFTNFNDCYEIIIEFFENILRNAKEKII